MPRLSPRRWFQFRLSTWFVLMTILAWAMMLRPWAYLILYDNPSNYTLSLGRWTGGISHNYFQFTANSIVVSPAERYRGIALNFGPHPDIFYPVVALVAFTGWKASWLVVEGRRRRSEADPSSALQNEKPPT